MLIVSMIYVNWYITNTASPLYQSSYTYQFFEKVILYRFAEDKLHSEM